MERGPHGPKERCPNGRVHRSEEADAVYDLRCISGRVDQSQQGHMDTDTDTRTYTRTRTCTHTHPDIHTGTHAHAPAPAHTHTQTCTHLHTRMLASHWHWHASAAGYNFASAFPALPSCSGGLKWRSAEAGIAPRRFQLHQTSLGPCVRVVGRCGQRQLGFIRRSLRFRLRVTKPALSPLPTQTLSARMSYPR